MHLLLKHHRGALQKLFQKYCLIGAKRMKINEFVRLLTCEKVLDDRVTKREAVLAFLLSKMLYIDDMKVSFPALAAFDVLRWATCP